MRANEDMMPKLSICHGHGSNMNFSVSDYIRDDTAYLSLHHLWFWHEWFKTCILKIFRGADPESYGKYCVEKCSNFWNWPLYCLSDQNVIKSIKSRGVPGTSTGRVRDFKFLGEAPSFLLNYLLTKFWQMRAHRSHPCQERPCVYGIRQLSATV